jgi:hypothetical protein
MTPRHQLAVGIIAHPVQHRRKSLELRRNFPKSYKWLALAGRVQGFLEEPEADRLYRLALAAPDVNAVIVELGSFRGRSSVLLPAGLLGKLNARLFCVDTFSEDEDRDYQRRFYDDPLQRGSRDLLSAFVLNVKCGVASTITPLRGFTLRTRAPGSFPLTCYSSTPITNTRQCCETFSSGHRP